MATNNRRASAAVTAAAAAAVTVIPEGFQEAAIQATPASALTRNPKNLYAGNVMYINENIKNPDQVYLTLMLRFVTTPATEAAPATQHEVEDTPVALFLDKAQFKTSGTKVGDLAAFKARAINVGNTTLDDGTPIFRTQGLDRAFGIQVASEKREEVELVVKDEVQSAGLKDRFSALMSGNLKGFLGS